MDYELIKLVRGYILIEVKDNTNTNIISFTLKDLQEKLNDKIVASTEEIVGMDYARLRISDCDDLFGIKETRQPKVSKRFAKAKYGTLKELQGIQEIVRLQMYNYLSGRITHKAFLEFYQQYETMLHEHGIIKVNDWNLDEHLDDEYFNDYLEAPELSRELNVNTKTRMFVTLESLKDEEGYCVIFKK